MASTSLDFLDSDPITPVVESDAQVSTASVPSLNTPRTHSLDFLDSDDEDSTPQPKASARPRSRPRSPEKDTDSFELNLYPPSPKRSRGEEPHSTSTSTSTSSQLLPLVPQQMSTPEPLEFDQSEQELLRAMMTELGINDALPGKDSSILDFLSQDDNTLMNAATVVGSAVEKHQLVSVGTETSKSYRSFPRDLSLTPTGDIPVHSEETISAVPWENYSSTKDIEIASRLKPEFARSLPRELVMYYLVPYPPPPASSSFDLETLQQRALVLFNIVGLKTLKAYGGTIIRFLDFCEKQKIPLGKRFPTDPKVMDMFLSSFATKVRADTVRKYADAFKMWHTINRQPFPLSSAALKTTIKGLRAVQPAGRSQRPPATYKDLIALHEDLDQSDPPNICLFAAATTAFFAMARSGDVTIPDRDAFDPEKHANGSSISFFPATRDFPEYATIKLPFDKVLEKEGDTLIIVSQSMDPRIDPIAALRKHIEVNSPSPSDFLFSSIPRSTYKGTAARYPLTKDHFMNTTNDVLRKRGRRLLSGHSWRIGGATQYLLAGVHPDFIKVVGRWRSDAFLVYWRNIKIIAAKNLSDAALQDYADEPIPSKTASTSSLPPRSLPAPPAPAPSTSAAPASLVTPLVHSPPRTRSSTKILPHEPTSTEQTSGTPNESSPLTSLDTSPPRVDPKDADYQLGEDED